MCVGSTLQDWGACWWASKQPYQQDYPLTVHLWCRAWAQLIVLRTSCLYDRFAYIALISLQSDFVLRSHACKIEGLQTSNWTSKWPVMVLHNYVVGISFCMSWDSIEGECWRCCSCSDTLPAGASASVYCHLLTCRNSISLSYHRTCLAVQRHMAVIMLISCLEQFQSTLCEHTGTKCSMLTGSIKLKISIDRASILSGLVLLPQCNYMCFQRSVAVQKLLICDCPSSVLVRMTDLRISGHDSTLLSSHLQVVKVLMATALSLTYSYHTIWQGGGLMYKNLYKCTLICCWPNMITYAWHMTSLVQKYSSWSVFYTTCWLI